MLALQASALPLGDPALARELGIEPRVSRFKVEDVADYTIPDQRPLRHGGPSAEVQYT